ncbi:GntR family transcriptional regulator [Saccharopolyspora sp. NPDC047091]|uniref:GntR family transcriptional regulator n=1 Tax=Saccharopolyspora sp. NPDC047091 TaxID=3155924 RepID=UPI003410B88F
MATLHQVIGNTLRQRIADGTYPPGSTIPSIIELMDEFDVARDTVRDAVARLANEGLVTPRRGIGTVVRQTSTVALAYEPGKAAAVWADQAQGGARHDMVITAEWVSPDREIRARLELGGGDTWRVLHRVRHQSKEGVVAQVVEQWIPESVVGVVSDSAGVGLADVATDAELRTDLFTLMKDGGEEPTTVTERISTRMPDPDEADALELPPGVPVLVTHRVTKRADGTPLETATMVGAGDRMSSTFTVPLSR